MKQEAKNLAPVRGRFNPPHKTSLRISQPKTCLIEVMALGTWKPFFSPRALSTSRQIPEHVSDWLASWCVRTCLGELYTVLLIITRRGLDIYLPTLAFCYMYFQLETFNYNWRRSNVHAVSILLCKARMMKNAIISAPHCSRI